MSIHTQDNSLDSSISEMLHAIYDLSQRYSQDWVSIRSVAKEQEGSEEFAPIISGLAEIAKASGLVSISTNGTRIKLTSSGLQKILKEQTAVQKISEVEQIARSVKKYAARLKRQVLNIQSIETVARAGGKFVQALSVDLDDSSALPETPVDFCSRDGGSSIHGRIVGQDSDRGILYVAFDSEVLQIHLPAALRVDRAFLLNQLAQSLQGLDEFPELGRAVLSQDVSGFPIAKENSAEVADMLAFLRAPWTRFLWGPPGAGKSYAIGHLSVKLLERNPNANILLAAPSNLSVDVTFIQFVKQLEKSNLKHLIDERKILRYGYPRHSEILERGELLGTPTLDQQSFTIKEISNKITNAKKRDVSNREIAILETELFAAQEELKRIVNEHVSQCKVVATTTTQAYLPKSPISRILWDSVLVDEVTMVPPAQCIYLSSIGQKRLLLAGDPRQLGPVYEEGKRASKEDYEWMGKDIFDKSEVSNGVGEDRKIAIRDLRLARITSQRRCSNQIWQKVSHLYPEVFNQADVNRVDKLRNLPPAPGESVVLMDVAFDADTAKCERVHQSWHNPYTGLLALDIALTVASEADNDTSFAIISPYRAHARMLQNWLKEKKQSNNDFVENIIVGTIHQFQGSEADVVIFDMVDGIGRNRVGKLLKGDIGIRLVNVAFTRARGKLIVIANKSWCKTKMYRDDNPLLWDMVVGTQSTQQVPVVPDRSTPSIPRWRSTIE